MATDWYYSSAGHQQGPVPATQIKQMAADGALLPDDLVWNKSLTEWVPAHRIKGLTFGDGQQEPAAQHQHAAPAVIPPLESKPAVAAPSQMLGYESPGGEAAFVTPRTIELLEKTRPWVWTMAIILFVIAGLIALGGFIMIAVVILPHRAFGAAIPIAAGYLAAAAVVGLPPIFLGRYARRIGQLVRLRRTVDLEQALEAQRVYWKLVAITTLVSIGLYFVAVGVIIAVAH